MQYFVVDLDSGMVLTVTDAVSVVDARSVEQLPTGGNDADEMIVTAARYCGVPLNALLQSDWSE